MNLDFEIEYFFHRRGQHHELLPFVHNAKHEEENIHLLLPLVQVMPQSSSAKLTGATIYLTT